MCGTFVGTFKYMSPERIKNQPYSYMSDIWSFGLVIMECATGLYPFHEHANCIEMAQTILDMDVPKLPEGKFSIELIDFCSACLHRDPDRRVAAEVLLGHPWLQKHGCHQPEYATDIVRYWIDDLTGNSSRK